MKAAFPTSGMVAAADGSGHQIYFESYGPTDAPPFVMVHGNAGYVFDMQKLSLWDLEQRRVVIIHARGVGHSKPAGDVDQNLYPDLAEDIETIRTHLGLEKISLFGWSAGAAVSCLYAEKYPQHCNEIVLYGAFLGGIPELKNYYARSRQQYPQGWREFCDDYGVQDEFQAVCLCNLDLLYGTRAKRHQAALRYEQIFGPVRISPHDFDRLVADRIIYANMIERNFGLNGRAIPVPPGAKFIRGENDYIGSAMPGEIIIKNAGHDIHDPHLQNDLRAVLAGVTRQFSPSPRPQQLQP